MHELITSMTQFLTDTIFHLGYFGITILMAIESSFIPFPSEVVMPPAGYLISQGKMTWFGVMASGILGSLIGALVNYYIARFVGRKFFENYGKYFFIKNEQLHQCDLFFAKHGNMATFTGRLVPVVRQLISLPAGLSRMNLAQFSLYTGVGAGIWCLVLTYIGFLVGKNQDLINQYLAQATWITLAGVGLLLIAYLAFHKFKKA